MSAMKEFYDLVSKDKDVKIELGTESLRALMVLLAEKGMNDDAKKALDAVSVKVAKAHGIDMNDTEEFSENELNAVAGGDVYCKSCIMGKKNCKEYSQLF